MYGITDIYSTFIEPNPDNPLAVLNDAGKEKAKDFIIAQFAARGREMDLEAKRAFNALRPDITGKHELSLEDTLP